MTILFLYGKSGVQSSTSEKCTKNWTQRSAWTHQKRSRMPSEIKESPMYTRSFVTSRCINAILGKPHQKQNNASIIHPVSIKWCIIQRDLWNNPPGPFLVRHDCRLLKSFLILWSSSVVIPFFNAALVKTWPFNWDNLVLPIPGSGGSSWVGQPTNPFEKYAQINLHHFPR